MSFTSRHFHLSDFLPSSLCYLQSLSPRVVWSLAQEERSQALSLHLKESKELFLDTYL